MHQALLARHFIPTPGGADQHGFVQYRADNIPAGYEVTHTAAKELWKEWWRTARHSGVHGIHMDLLIFARDTWYPIRNIICSQGTLFITTLVSEVSFAGSEQLTWLRRLPEPSSARSNPPTAPKLARSLQPLSKATPPSTAYPERPIASTPSNFLSKRDESECTASNPELRQVLRIRQGKLYVKTALGELVVEGSELKYRLEEGTRVTEPQKPLNFNGYREREGQAVNQ
jgi:hypothetical protein